MKVSKIKKVFLLLAMISLSILLVAIPIIGGIYAENLGLCSSYMHEDKKIIEDDFYRSNIFEFKVLRPITYWLGTSVKDVEDSVDEYIRNHTYTRWDDKKQKNIEIVPTKEQAKKAIEREIENSKEELEQLENIKFMVVSAKYNTYYTNTKYKTLEEYKRNTGGYANIELDKDKRTISYIKIINGKKVINSNSNIYSKVFDATSEENIKIYMSFPKQIYNMDMIFNNYTTYNQAIKTVQTYMILAVISLVVFILSTLIYKKVKGTIINKNGKLFDLLIKIPIDILIGLMFIDSILLFICFSNPQDIPEKYILWICEFIGVFSIILALYLLSKIYSNYEKKLDILKNTVIYKIYYILKNIIVYKIYSKSRRLTVNILSSSKKIPLIKQIILVAIICAIGDIFLFLINGADILVSIILCAPIGIFAFYIVKKLCYLAQIIDGADKIKNGELNYKIDVKGYDNFAVLAQNLNNIGEGLEKSIENQLRSERMKSELITNVSHDLKTPLTSIINYIELIKKEENIKPEHIKDYVNILDSKSKRLKTLIEDLFEASKASSGNLELNMESIDVTQLLRQSIGEMEEKLSYINLDIKLRIPNEKLYIYADGKRMYRVFENLLSNIAKYSLSNTRVYIDLVQDNEDIRLTMKNISSYELNFDSNEITERFKRADDSRNTEGSGLGLAIAKDLVSIQGGNFEIETDGDLFKVNLEFKKLEKQEVQVNI